MDLSTNSIGWHRTREWLDEAITLAEKTSRVPHFGLTPEQDEYRKGFFEGQMIAFMKVRSRFNTPEESALVEQTRREMFG